MLRTSELDDKRDVKDILQPSGMDRSVSAVGYHDTATHFVKVNGIMCPRCMLSLLGPRPVYRKNGLPCS